MPQTASFHELLFTHIINKQITVQKVTSINEINAEIFFQSTSTQEQTPTPLSNSSIYSSNLTLSDDTYVTYCSFVYCHSQTNGGALCLESSGKRLYIEYSTFKNCSTSNSLGAAIQKSYEGDCVISFVCGINCSLLFSELSKMKFD